MNRSQVPPREIALLRGIAEGKTAKAVAREQGIHPDTMRTYADRVRIRLGALNMAQAVLKAREAGLI